MKPRDQTMYVQTDRLFNIELDNTKEDRVEGMKARCQDRCAFGWKQESAGDISMKDGGITPHVKSGDLGEASRVSIMNKTIS